MILDTKKHVSQLLPHSESLPENKGKSKKQRQKWEEKRDIVLRGLYPCQAPALLKSTSHLIIFNYISH